jgi:outer membrane protein assembly factor BamB
MKNFSVRIFFCALPLMFSALLAEGCSPSPNYPESSTSHTFKIIDENTNLMWSINNIYVPQDDFNPMMSASSGLVCFLGDIVYPPNKELSCLSSETGGVLWQKSLGVPTGILMDTSGIYVAYGGMAGLDKLDYFGNSDWSLSMMESSVKYLHFNDAQLQLLLLPERFLVVEKDSGKTIEDIKGEGIIYSDETERFLINYGLESRSLGLEEINWQSNISSNNIRLSPLFTEDQILLRTGRVKGTLLALGRNNGQVSWQTENTVISNIAFWTSKNIIFVLTEDGQLLRINSRNGAQSALLNLSPSPLILNGDSVVGGYELDFDESSNTLFVLLGDSRQLFAFHVK